MTAWSVADRDRLLGPFTHEEVGQALARGDLSPDCKVWCEGMEGWAPIEAHFPLGRRSAGVRGFNATGLLRGLGLTLVTLALLLALAASVALTYLGALDLVPVQLAGRVWLASGIGLALLAVAAPVLWWRASARWPGAEARGVVRILFVLVSIGAGSLAGLQLMQARHVDRLAVAAEQLRDYQFFYEPRTQVLRIEGMIGRGFAHALRRELANRSVRRVEITSTGGLIDPALEAARQLQALPHLTVAARGVCASACVIVLMAGGERLADYDMAIDFHASAPIASLPGDWWTVMLRRQDKAADSYMIARGVPKGYLTQSARLGPDKVYSVPAVVLVEQKMLTGLLDEEDRPLTAPQARARLAEEGVETLAPEAQDISGA